MSRAAVLAASRRASGLVYSKPGSGVSEPAAEAADLTPARKLAEALELAADMLEYLPDDVRADFVPRLAAIRGTTAADDAKIPDGDE